MWILSMITHMTNFSFNMYFMLNYTNNQLIYYYIFDAIFAAEQAHFQQLIKQHKTSLKLIRWNSTFNNDSNKSDTFKEFITSMIENSNSDCSALLSDYKSIKINMLDISKLTYNSMIVQYNNWFTNIKTDFDKNSARFSINHQKIILISIIFNKQLKMTLNSVMQNNSDLSHHWQKFKHWF